MSVDLPAINPKDLIKIFENEGWQIQRRANHDLAMSKYFNGKNHITIIPMKDKSMPKRTLMAILGIKQTQIGRERFLELYRMLKSIGFIFQLNNSECEPILVSINFFPSILYISSKSGVIWHSRCC